jgi:hypothetical protein
MIIERQGALLASGALAQALSDQLVPEQRTPRAVQIGLSFRSKSGTYCRTFQLQRFSSAGLACRRGAQWQVQVLGHSESPGANAAGYRQAASAMPAWLAQQVDTIIVGQPLDAAGEASARAHGWH